MLLILWTSQRNSMTQQHHVLNSTSGQSLRLMISTWILRRCMWKVGIWIKTNCKLKSQLPRKKKHQRAKRRILSARKKHQADSRRLASQEETATSQKKRDSSSENETLTRQEALQPGRTHCKQPGRNYTPAWRIQEVGVRMPTKHASHLAAWLHCTEMALHL